MVSKRWKPVRVKNHRTPGPTYRYDIPEVNEIVELKCADGFTLEGRLVSRFGGTLEWAGNGVKFNDVTHWRPAPQKRQLKEMSQDDIRTGNTGDECPVCWLTHRAQNSMRVLHSTQTFDYSGPKEHNGNCSSVIEWCPACGTIRQTSNYEPYRNVKLFVCDEIWQAGRIAKK